MQAEWAKARVSENPISMVYLDIDFFKKFNDTYGHQLGDECLRSVAGCLVAGVRGASDCVARYGGEEFVVLLPETTADSAKATAERNGRAHPCFRDSAYRKHFRSGDRKLRGSQLQVQAGEASPRDSFVSPTMLFTLPNKAAGDASRRTSNSYALSHEMEGPILAVL